MGGRQTQLLRPIPITVGRNYPSPPRKLNTLPFAAMEHLRPGVEFGNLPHYAFAAVLIKSTGNALFFITLDLLAVVANCGAQQHTTDQSKHFREAIVMDQRVEDNEQMLISYTLRSPSASLSSLNLAAIEDEVLPISNIPDCHLRYRLFLWKAGYHFLIVPNRFTYSLAHTATSLYASRLKIRLLSLEMGAVAYVSQVFSGDTITVTVSETVAETMLSLTAEQIYENVAAKREPLSTVRINQQFDHKLSRLQLQKPIYRFPDQTPGMLAVASFTEAETPVLKALSLPMASGEAGGGCPMLNAAKFA
ncbi:hypothetical protein FXO37_21092 [Capsicum annuum]|nr:hypothetical protein FXO37_21092 [Capsicum annuum]